ncbi:peptide/nickel transport system ATP-binding protein [Microterricola gilva]|uniref:Peptide/nickel transport system ATP-binding protein n=1 Tax=Microterricola gilva TaxID=393267 RepID=A0A4Q8AI28_9MICO|nr:ABC transporter ATP-binding protein [Microterricola gilva]RZU64072.1 peptide/nickel transport system ATP-binding protein [Microterricola gilva]
MAVLEARNLNVRIPTEDGVIHAVRDVSFSVEAGEFFGIVGESGSGKSVMVQAIMGLIPQAEVTGEVFFDGRDLLTMSEAELRAIRGASISMVFQDPLSSLHPQFTIGWQIIEQIRTHRSVSKAEAKTMAIEMLGKVGIPNPAERFDSYPHQFSGGMRQRVMIAMALSLNPRLVIADEPTTALDSTVQAQILELLDVMRKEFDATIVMITHDLNVLGRVADTLMVMYAGHRLELGAAEQVFGLPVHPYTAGLLRSSPSNYEPGTALVPIPGRPPSLLNAVTGCVFAARCPEVMERCHSERPPLRRYENGSEAQCWLEEPPAEAAAAAPQAARGERSLTIAGQSPVTAIATAVVPPLVRLDAVELSFRNKRRREDVPVLRGIDLTVERGETLGLVGESGCGKSTLARVIAGLIPAGSGEVEVAGHRLSAMNRDEWRGLRRDVQLIFQDPYGALNPRRRVGSIIGDPFRLHKVCSGEERKRRVQELMELVGLNPEHYNRFPAQFSGGQRQRIGIARAVALRPALIICDEPVSALDVSIQAQVLNLMSSLQREFNLSYLFISHDLSVVRHVCDRIAVMDAGRIIELAPTEDLYRNPQQQFTKTLLAASAPLARPERGATPRLIDSRATAQLQEEGAA